MEYELTSIELDHLPLIDVKSFVGRDAGERVSELRWVQNKGKTEAFEGWVAEDRRGDGITFVAIVVAALEEMIATGTSISGSPTGQFPDRVYWGDLVVHTNAETYATVLRIFQEYEL